MKQNLSLIFGIYLGLMSGCLLAMNALSKRESGRTIASVGKISTPFYLSPSETLRYKMLIQKSDKLKRVIVKEHAGI